MPTSWLDRFFDLLLYAYPPSFRCAYAVKMRQLFRDACRDRLREARPRGLSRFAFHILTDAAKSAVREWFAPIVPSIAPAGAAGASASGGVPVFFTFDDTHPRPQVLFQGGIASLAAFTAVIFAASYGHPGIRARPGGIAFLASRPQAIAQEHQAVGFWQRFLSRSKPPVGASVATRNDAVARPRLDGNRATSWLEWLARNRAMSRPVFAGMSSDGNVRPPAPRFPIHLPARVLNSYAGKYVIDPPFDLKISITVVRGQLALGVADRRKISLLAASSTKFLADQGRWVEFTKDAKGRMKLALVEPGWKIEARRQTRPPVKKP